MLLILENTTGWIGLMVMPSASGIRGEYRLPNLYVQLKKEERSSNASQSHVPFLSPAEYERFDERYAISIV